MSRCGDCCRGIGRRFHSCSCGLLCIILILCLFVAVVSLLVVLSAEKLYVDNKVHCQSSPGLRLEDVSIRNMTFYQNNNNSTMPTTSYTDTPWEVKSDISVNLSTWNPNSVAGCFTTYRRMYVFVETYKGQLILRQEVPLGFWLDPLQSRSVLLDLKGDHIPVERELGSLLEVELRNASAVELQFRFDTRYMSHSYGRKAGWMRMACNVIAKTPLNYRASKNSSHSSQGSSAASGIISSSYRAA